MNYTQNEKIEQVTDSTMVVGVDIGSQIHYARAFDNRGRELTKRIFSFHNDLEGFNSFSLWAETLKTENKKIAVLIRDLVYSRDGIMKQHNISANRIQRWLAIHFPEYLGLYTRFDAISFLTDGKKECRAWTIRKGTKAPQAAGKIHSDFERGFIRASVIGYGDLEANNFDYAAVKAKGLQRTEGKEYVVKDGDVIEFLFNV